MVAGGEQMGLVQYNDSPDETVAIGACQRMASPLEVECYIFAPVTVCGLVAVGSRSKQGQMVLVADVSCLKTEMARWRKTRPAFEVDLILAPTAHGEQN